jgi:putative ABC transport system permease protein
VAIPLHELTAQTSRFALTILFGAVGFVLLIACANFANLLFARASARRKEIAIRAAIGANRLHLIKQLLTESVLLALVGGAVGLLISIWGVDLLLEFAPPSLSRVNPIGVDLSVLSFTFLISVGTGIIFGLFPALHASKLDLTSALKEEGRSTHSGLIGLSFRNVLVVGQVALALVLLIGSGLMLNSLVRLLNVDKGFDPDNLLTFNVALPATYKTPEQIKAFYQEALRRIERLPGVSSAGTVDQLPLGDMGLRGDFQFEGQPPQEGNWASKIFTSGDYFSAMRIPLSGGRGFDASDSPLSKNVAMINEAFARKYCGDINPLGQRLSIDNDAKRQPIWREVVGVVEDIKQTSLGEESEPAIFVPHLQTGRIFWLSFATFVVRSEVDPTQLALSVQREIQTIDSNLPAFGIRTMEQVVSDSVSDARFNSLLIAVFAGVAMILAVVGVYGVVSYSVTQRTREVGIRMAVGAAPSDIVKLIVGQGMFLSIAGILLGLGLAFGVTRLITTLLFGITPTDWPTFTFVSFTLILATLIACVIPGRRAMRVDPLVALRQE